VPIKLLLAGDGAEIYVYVNQRGDAIASDFIDGLSLSDAKKIVALLRRFADRGEVQNREKFRLEEKPIYAFKSSQVRLLCFYLPDASKRTIVLTHGLIKKQDELPPPELIKAKRIYAEVVSI
jgi:hypothetical protein